MLSKDQIILFIYDCFLSTLAFYNLDLIMQFLLQ